MCHIQHLITTCGTAGWSYQKKGLQTRREGNVTIYGIPYSEHSSFAELRDCVKRLRPKRLIPTVNCPDAASARAIVDRFADLMDLSRDKSRLDCYFGRTSSAPVCSTSSCRPPMEHTASAYSPEHSTAPAETKLLLEAVKTEPARCPAYTGQQDELKSSTQSCNHHVITDDDSQDAIGGFLSPENITGQDCQPQGQSSHAPFQTAAVPIGCASEGQAEKEEHDATYPLGWADDDENGSDVSNSPLPLRRLAGPGHAFSAPAALGQGTEAQWDDESEVDGLSQPLMPDSVQNQQELLVTLHQCSPAEVSTRPMAVAKGQGLQKAIDDLHQLNRDTAKQQAAVSDNNQLRTEGACPDPDDAELYSVEGCDKHTHAAQQDVIVKDVPAFVMDSIDIAEQTRILSHIQQEALHARQCLPTKKRQLTLGCFVVPKRVK